MLALAQLERFFKFYFCV